METTNPKVLSHKRNGTKHRLDGVLSKLNTLAAAKNMLTQVEIEELYLIKMRLKTLLSKESWAIGTEVLGLKLRKKDTSS